MEASGSVASTTSFSPGGSSAILRLAIVRGSGQARPRASTVVTLSIVTAPAYRLAAVLASGLRTADIKSEGTTAASTTQMGEAILKELQKLHA